MLTPLWWKVCCCRGTAMVEKVTLAPQPCRGEQWNLEQVHESHAWGIRSAGSAANIGVTRQYYVIPYLLFTPIDPYIRQF